MSGPRSWQAPHRSVRTGTRAPSNTAAPVAPHPALRATFSPLAGRREKTRAPLAGRREKACAPLAGRREKACTPLAGRREKACAPLAGRREKACAPLAGRREKARAPLAGRREKARSFPSVLSTRGGLSLSLLPARGEKVPKADEGRFSRRAYKHRLPRYRQRNARTAATSNTATPVAPHPALRATFSPLAGRREKARAPLVGRRKKARAPLAGRKKKARSPLSLLPASGEKVPKADEGRFSRRACKHRLPRYR
jgi:hypothetical protein